jgi:uncharacterized protein DUF5069
LRSASLPKAKPEGSPQDAANGRQDAGAPQKFFRKVAAPRFRPSLIDMNKNVSGKDLTKEAPRSPRVRVGGYAILGRTLDKCRALIGDNIGEYHFDCPLDNMLFGFKGVKGDDFKAEVEKGASDPEMARWLDTHGEKKTPDEVKRWSDEMETANPLYNNPEKRDYYIEETKKLGLDPATTPLFDWLDADDKASYGAVAAAR